MPPNGSSATAASGTPASTRWKSGSMAEPAPDRRLGFTLTRVFAAPRERVWREWTEPEAFADWFGGAEAEVPLDTVAMDVRPGGAWRATMLHGGREIRWKGEYIEVQPPERLVLTFSDQPDDAPHELVVVMLRELGDGRTEMVVEQHGRLPPGAYDAARNGWGGFFDVLAERLAGGGRTARAPGAPAAHHQAGGAVGGGGGRGGRLGPPGARGGVGGRRAGAGG